MPVLSLPGRDYRGGEWCVKGGHVVFVPVIPMASIVMRGMMPLAVLNRSRAALHGARASYVADFSASGGGNKSAKLERHFATHGAPTACVLIKYHDAEALAACRRRGAVVLLDCIDNKRCSAASSVGHEQYARYDALVVQTATHARWLSTHGVTAIVQPHPHGDHRASPRVAHPLRQRLRSVGLVYGDTKNMPSQRSLTALCLACARANASLYLIYSTNTATMKFAFRGRPMECHHHGGGASNATTGLLSALRATEQAAATAAAAAATATVGQHGEAPHAKYVDATGRCAAGAGGGGGVGGGGGASAPPLGCGGGADQAAQTMRRGGHEHHELGQGLNLNLSSFDVDVTGQHRFYSSAINEQIKATIDVGLLWPPRRVDAPPFAVENRPGTRQHWWWAQSIPTVAYPMPAYVEGAARIGYPQELVHLGLHNVTDALCALQRHRARACLQRRVMRGAVLTSPLSAALELLTAVCVVADAAGIRLNLDAAATGANQIMTRSLIKGGG